MRVVQISLLIAGLVVTATARADDRWTAPHPGVRHLHRRAGVKDFHLVTVDLRTPGLRVETTTEAELQSVSGSRGHRWSTTSQFARRHRLDIAINANYYDIFHAALTSCGLAMAQGQSFSSAYSDRRLGCWESVGFGPMGRAEFFDSHGRTFGPAPFGWVREVVTGSPRVLRDGRVVEVTHPRHALRRNPRTVLGLNRDRTVLYLLVVNGREGRNLGLTTAAAGEILASFGATDAVNLDGGGSSTLYLRAEGGVVSHLADGAERGVATHLGLAFDAPTEMLPEPVPEPVRETPAAPAAVAARGPVRGAMATQRPETQPVAGAALGGPRGGLVGLAFGLWLVSRARCRSLRLPSRGSRL